MAGFPVFGSAQPTAAGLKTILDKMRPEKEGEKAKVNYYNMRQEPVVYLNGTPFAPRAAEQLSHLAKSLERWFLKINVVLLCCSIFKTVMILFVFVFMHTESVLF